MPAARYSSKLLDHFRHPRNVGVLEVTNGGAAATNPQCGDTTQLGLLVRDGVIAEVRWQTRGCSASIAASSAASELARGRSLASAEAIDRQAVSDALGGLSPAQAHSAALAVDVLRAAIKDCRVREARGI